MFAVENKQAAFASLSSLYLLTFFSFCGLFAIIFVVFILVLGGGVVLGKNSNLYPVV